jgi:phosphatidylserine/phosphatidylglycerophosphate/cardiolipin synthase-like enzyme
MSTRIVGRIVVGTDGAAGTGLAACRVVLFSPDDLAGFDLASGTTAGDGRFDITFPGRGLGADGERRAPRRIELVVHDAVGRELARFGPFDDGETETLEVGDLAVRGDDAEGLLVTLGTGAHRAGAGTLPGWGVSHGNRVALMMDEDAFARAAELIAGAQKSLLMSQLFFPVPAKFDEQPGREEIKCVFRFGGGPLPRPLDPVADERPERLLLAAADRGVTARVLLNAPELSLFFKVAACALVFPFFNVAGVLGMWDLLDLESSNDTEEGQRYFGASGRGTVHVRPFEQNMLSAGVMHSKLVVADRTHALSIGSPFSQGYVDTPDHPVDSPQRGKRDGFPMHDAGFGVSGPAVEDLHATLRLLWNEDAPEAQKLADEAAPAATGPEPAHDRVCTLQIVRTLTEDRFKDGAAGEKGILEAYLRAIDRAEDFVYLETQYFTNDAIGHALVQAMKRRPQLQVIVLLNIRPDVPFYPFKQRRLITRIREAIGETAGLPRQFGVFTRWSHEPREDNAEALKKAGRGDPRPRLLPVYVHAKVGVVDAKWATIGSANLDGLSLDSSLVSDVLNFLPDKLLGRPIVRDQRAIEVNAVLLDPPGTPPADGVVDLVRRRLWAEHLGFRTPDHKPAVDAPALALTGRPAPGWLDLWNQRAKDLRERLTANPFDALPDNDFGRVLPWPDEDETFKHPREHLDALGIKSFKVIPLKGTRKFDFARGDWDPQSKAAMDYP